jgi:hypothetical protein
MDKKDSLRVYSFKLGGHKIKVKYLDIVRDPDNGEQLLGLCNPMTNEILIATSMKNYRLSEEVIRHSLHHEIVHFICKLMNQPELDSNETFVDMFGMFLHQFQETKNEK